MELKVIVKANNGQVFDIFFPCDLEETLELIMGKEYDEFEYTPLSCKVEDGEDGLIDEDYFDSCETLEDYESMVDELIEQLEEVGNLDKVRQ